jgi:hypothetical protein
MKETQSDTIFGTVEVYKKTDDVYVKKTKNFRNQFCIKLDPGEYIIQVLFNDRSYVERIHIDEYESLFVINIPESDIRLADFDFSNAIFLATEAFELAVKDRKITHMEF